MQLDLEQFISICNFPLSLVSHSVYIEKVTLVRDDLTLTLTEGGKEPNADCNLNWKTPWVILVLSHVKNILGSYHGYVLFSPDFLQTIENSSQSVKPNAS